ncbi:terminase large subunit domain-containing protein [Streptomyces sulphureus]|uniref:terminase large subunit domain-containing protein n=1 Tax=Streptomyces sulphureus TaxID=47758 RepID=UPI00036BC0AF|nr:terminase family protein [Streptomyces sulphureus]
MTGHAYAGYSDAELHAEARRLAALQDPAMMGLYLNPGGAYRVRAHTRLIASALAELGPDADRLLVTTPPQVGKSVLVSELLPIWWLARRPADRIAIASYAGSLATKKSRAVRRLVAEHGEAFGLHLQRGEQTAYDWSLAEGGGVRAVGVGGGLTGHPITGVGIVDDPHKDRSEADTALMREHVWDWWSSVFLSRLRPGVPVVLVQTRWHPNDLAGRVLDHEGTTAEGGRWRVVHLPALATQETDPLGRAAGEPLTHPALADEARAELLAHWHDKRRTTTPRDWGALYQGDPQPAAGALLTHAEMADAYCPSPTAPTRRAVAVDPSGGGRDTAGVVAGYLGTDQRLYLTHDRTRQMSSDQWARAACTLAAETEATLIHVEKNYGGDMVTLAIRTAWDALQRERTIAAEALPPFVQPVTARAGKLLRAEPVAQQWREGRVRLAAHLPELVSEWVSWQPGSDSPGRIDASVYLAYGLLRAPGARESISSPAGVSLSSVGTGRASVGAATIGRSGYVR